MDDTTTRRADLVRKRREDEHFNLFARLSNVSAASRRQGQRLLQHGGGLSIVEWRVLWDLAEAGPMTIREMSEIQRTDHSLLSRALPDIRAKGLVRIDRDPGDGRQMIVTLTDAGRAAYDGAAPIMERRRAAVREVLSEEDIRTFVSLIGRFEDFLAIPIETLLDGRTEPAR